jgi:hypothetical protein
MSRGQFGWLIRRRERQPLVPRPPKDKEIVQELSDLKKSPKKDGRFIQMVRALSKPFWERTREGSGELLEQYIQRFNQSQNEYLSWMGAKLGGVE